MNEQLERLRRECKLLLEESITCLHSIGRKAEIKFSTMPQMTLQKRIYLVVQEMYLFRCKLMTSIKIKTNKRVHFFDKLKSLINDWLLRFLLVFIDTLNKTRPPVGKFT